MITDHEARRRLQRKVGKPYSTLPVARPAPVKSEFARCLERVNGSTSR